MRIFFLFRFDSGPSILGLLGGDGAVADKAQINSDDLNVLRLYRCRFHRWRFGELYSGEFCPDDFSGMSLEYKVTRCEPDEFEAKKASAYVGDQILALRQGSESPRMPKMPLTPDTVETEARVMIAAMSKALGTDCIDPTKLEISDSLLALAGFDHVMALSIEKSIFAHFDILAGGGRLLTVGDAIRFAKDELEMADDDDLSDGIAARILRPSLPLRPTVSNALGLRCPQNTSVTWINCMSNGMNEPMRAMTRTA